MAERRITSVDMFMDMLKSIPGEFTFRMNMLKSEEWDDIRDQIDPLVEELEAMRKSFFYRRKRYWDKNDEVEATKFMKFVHDTMKMFNEQDKEFERIISES